MKHAGHSDRLLWQAHRTIGAVANRFGPVGRVGFCWMIVMALFCCRDETLKAQSVRDEFSKMIRSVRVEGNEAVSSSVILGKNKSRAGARFNEKLVDEDARRIIALPEILDVRWQARPVDGKIELVFIVTESPQITEIDFVGNKHVTADELNKEIDFKVGEFLDAYLIKNSAQAIAELYRKKGYYSVRVEVDETLMETTRKIRYVIVEGPKLRIRKVEFQAEPRQSISTMKLKSLVKSRAYFPILNSGLLDDRQLEQDRLAIANHYHSQGFLDARVFVQTQMNDERTRGTLRFVIEEGVRYQVVSIRFEGNSAFSDEKLTGALTLEPGDVLTQERNIQAIRTLQRLYGGQGYVYVRVRLEPEFTDLEGEVVAVFKINEGSAYGLGRLVIRGNTQTQDKVIRREYDRYGFLPSGLYDTVAMDRATRRLRGSRWFENVSVTPIGNDPNERDALVEVKETLTGLISFGIGISTDGRIGGRFKREEQNFDISRWPRSLDELFEGKSFRGGGQYMSIDFFPSTRETTGRIRFREPYLFDQPNYFNLDLFLSRRWQESYIERRRGGRMTVGHRFENDWSVDMSLRAERVIIRRRSSRWFGLSD
ncbi:MAG: BamA/TamA family outer membrane protein, partial [Planctomycetes bacterium]|nr:BamA/TamA family outer membrane protein [Planctomycetota bacterium]